MLMLEAVVQDREQRRRNEEAADPAAKAMPGAQQAPNG
jgi:hypothetical protein